MSYLEMYLSVFGQIVVNNLNENVILIGNECRSIINGCNIGHLNSINVSNNNNNNNNRRQMHNGNRNANRNTNVNRNRNNSFSENDEIRRLRMENKRLSELNVKWRTHYTHDIICAQNARHQTKNSMLFINTQTQTLQNQVKQLLIEKEKMLKDNQRLKNCLSKFDNALIECVRYIGEGPSPRYNLVQMAPVRDIGPQALIL